MTLARTLVVAAALLQTSLPGPVEAQDAEEIIRRHVAALGGSEALATVRALRYVRVVQDTEDGETTSLGPAVFFSMRPYYYRTENLEAGTLYLSDGTRAWRGKRTNDANAVQWEELSRVLPLRELDFDRPFGSFIGFEAKGHEAVYLGRTVVDAVPLEAVRVAWVDGEEWEYYFDPSTGLCRGYDARPGAPGGWIRIEDYRPVGDVLIPHRNTTVDTLPDGSVRLHERLYSEFELNPEFPADFFTPRAPRPPVVRPGLGPDALQ